MLVAKIEKNTFQVAVCFPEMTSCAVLPTSLPFSVQAALGKTIEDHIAFSDAVDTTTAMPSVSPPLTTESFTSGKLELSLV